MSDYDGKNFVLTEKELIFLLSIIYSHVPKLTSYEAVMFNITDKLSQQLRLLTDKRRKSMVDTGIWLY